MEITVNQIRKMIKDFTKVSPPDTWEGDRSYRTYLAKCEKLLDLDLKLVTCDEYEDLEEIFEEVKKIVD